MKPLHLLTAAPSSERLRLDSPHGPIVGDLFLPAGRFGPERQRASPGLILVMGVKMSDRDRPILIGFAQTMARLGFVVVWPRLEALDAGLSLPEEPDTVVAAVRYLEGRHQVNRGRISILGFSVGASAALVAASDPRVAERVHAVVFFGGYYDIFAYPLSLATRTATLDNRTVEWHPADWATGHFREIHQTKGAEEILKIFDAETREEAERLLTLVPAWEVAELRRFSPAEHIDGARARLFILHDRGDHLVPYTESVKLSRAVPAGMVRAFVLTDLFEHVQPKEGVSWEALRDITRLYGFVHAAMGEPDR